MNNQLIWESFSMFKHVIKMRLPAIKKILFGEGKVAGQKMKLVSGKGVGGQRSPSWGQSRNKVFNF